MHSFADDVRTGSRYVCVSGIACLTVAVRQSIAFGGTTKHEGPAKDVQMFSKKILWDLSLGYLDEQFAWWASVEAALIWRSRTHCIEARCDKSCGEHLIPG